MAFGFAEYRDIERVVRAVLVSERTSQNDRTRLGSGGSSAPACSYIAASTSSITPATGSNASSHTVQFYGLSTSGAFSVISTGETVWNYSKEYIYANQYFSAQREYGSHNYVVPEGAGSFALVKTDAAITAGSAGTVSIYSSSSSDTGDNLSATNIIADVASGTWGFARKVNTAWYLAVGDPCSTGTT